MAPTDRKISLIADLLKPHGFKRNYKNDVLLYTYDDIHFEYRYYTYIKPDFSFGNNDGFIFFDLNRKVDNIFSLSNDISTAVVIVDTKISDFFINLDTNFDEFIFNLSLLYNVSSLEKFKNTFSFVDLYNIIMME